MHIRILAALLRKEILLLKRNPIIPKIVIMMPLMVMLVLPLIANLDVKNVNIVIVDNDHSQLSRRIISDISHNGYLKVEVIEYSHSEALRIVEDGKADVLFTIPHDYSKKITSNAGELDIEANGVNATKGMLGSQYVAQSIVNTLTQWKEQQNPNIEIPETSVINRYNPTLNFKNYMIPALMVVLLIIICGFLPTLNLVSEKETGTIEAMNVTPVGKLTFVLSKLIPFWIIGLLVITVGILVGGFVYGLWPVGNVLAVYLATILFTLLMSGLGVVIANGSTTMLQSIFVMFAFIIVFQLMGGLFTPIASMPEWAQIITYGVPPRYFIEIMRSVYLKGTPVSELWIQYLALLGYALVLCILAALTYKKQY